MSAGIGRHLVAVAELQPDVMTAAHFYSCNSGRQFGRRHNTVVYALKKMVETDLGLMALSGRRRRVSSLGTLVRVGPLIPGNEYCR